MKRTALILMLSMALSCTLKENTVTVVNSTEETIREVTVSVCDSTWHIQSLAPGEREIFTVVYNRDDSFHVTKNEQSESFGYVTHGITGDETEIVFSNQGISFTQLNNSSAY